MILRVFKREKNSGLGDQPWTEWKKRFIMEENHVISKRTSFFTDSGADECP